MKPAWRLVLVAALQVLLLLSIVGFREFAVRTGDTVTLKVATTDTVSLTHSYSYVQYDISRIDRSNVTVDGNVTGDVYVEIRRGDDGYWHAVAIHDERHRTFSGTVLIQGNASTMQDSAIFVHYNIENVGVSPSAARGLPSGTGHEIAVEVRVDRFGDPVPRHVLVDGVPFALTRH